MRFLDLFSGVGGFRLALEHLGHEAEGYVEIDKYARKSYEAIFHTEGEWTREDITTVTDEEWQELRGSVDIICGGSPCQSFSIAGDRGGFEDTRGTLFFDYVNAIKNIQPKYFIFENVKGLLSHDKGETIKTILHAFDEVGYALDLDLFNSKYYGVPQNRERVYIVGKRKDLVESPVPSYRTSKLKSIKTVRDWAAENVQLIQLLPSMEGLEVTTKLVDVLEDEVEDKYYMSEDKTYPLIQRLEQKGIPIPTGDMNMVGLLDMKGNETIRRVYDPQGVSPTLTTMGGGHREPKILEGVAVREAVKSGYTIANEGDSVNILYPNSKTRRGRVGKEISGTLQAATDSTQVVIEDCTPPTLKVRKLTPLECFRLQAFPGWAFEKAQAVNSNSQLYKQSGNSVTVSVVRAIAESLIGPAEY